MGYRDELGIAVRVTTVGAVPFVIRAAWPSTAIDNGLGEHYDPDLLDLSDMASSVASPTNPVASNSSAGLVIANRGGALSAAVNAGVNFDGARLEVWRTRNDEFNSLTDPLVWGGELDELAIGLDDEKLDTTARGPLKALEGIKYPNRYVTGDDAPQATLGKLIPIRFGYWANGNRYSELLCTKASNGEVTLYDSHAAGGGFIKCAAVNAVPSGGRQALDSLVWLVERSKYDPTNPRGMMSHGPGSPRRSVAYIDTTNQDENRATFRIGNRVTITPPPEDTPDPVDQVDPCQTVTEEPTSDPAITEQCPAVPPDVPHDSWGGVRADEFDPENDVVLAKHGGPVGINPDGDGYHNNVASFGGICDTILRRQLGIPTSKLKTSTFLSPTEWPGQGTQTELAYVNAPQLEESYDLLALLAAGALENRALFYEDAGKIALRRARFVGSGTVAYAIEPRVISASGIPTVVKGRWGDFANAVTFTAFGHGIAPDLLPYASVYRENADSIAERLAAGLLDRVPYVVGQEFNRAFGVWLDGRNKEQFKAVAGDLLAILSSRHQIIEVTVVPPLDELATVEALKLGDLVSLVWPSYDDGLGVPRARQPLIPTDEPAVCPIIGINPSQFDAVFTFRVLRYLGAGGTTASACTIAKYTAPDATFPAELGGGSMTEWDDGWTDEQKAYATCNGGFYGRSVYGPG